MTISKSTIQSLDELAPFDLLTFGDRTQPCRVRRVETDVPDDEYGRIRVKTHVTLDGPQGATIYLQRTAGGRLRACPSAPYGAFENVDASTVEVVAQAEGDIPPPDETDRFTSARLAAEQDESTNRDPPWAAFVRVETDAE